MKRSSYRNTNRGFREHLGIAVRSSWENNVLEWLNHNKLAWDYEPEIFYFNKIKRGTRSYTPDIKLYHKGTRKKEYDWIEVKGYLKPQDRTKTRRFRMYYPEEFAKLKVITKNATAPATTFYDSLDVPVLAFYDDLKRQYSHLKYWE